MEKRVGAYLLLLEFPKENERDPNFDWLRTRRLEVEQFCDDCCFRVGTFHLVPEPYFPVLDRYLREAHRDYRVKGYNPLFKVVRASFSLAEYAGLRRVMLDHVFAKLEDCLTILDSGDRAKEEVWSRVVHQVSKDLAKAQERVLLFQLDKHFPRRMPRLHDVISVLKEKVAEHAVQYLPVVVTEV